MAAKLTWFKGYLRLGRLVLGRVGEDADGHFYRVSVPANYTEGHESLRSKPYERRNDAKQDCLAEVRRLLGDAGVDVA